MNIVELSRLLGRLEENLKTQVVSDPYGGRALVQKLSKIKESKKLGKVEEGDLNALDAADTQELVDAYLTSLVDPHTISDEDVELFNKLAGDSKVTKNTKDLEQRYGYLKSVLLDFAGGIEPKIELSGEGDKKTLVAKLTHPEAKTADGKAVENLVGADLPQDGYGYKAADGETPEVPAKLSYEDAGRSVQSLTGFVAYLNRLTTGERKAEDISKFVNDSAKINALYDKVLRIEKTLRENEEKLASLDVKYQSQVEAVDEVFSKEPAEKYTPKEAKDISGISDEELKKVNELRESQASLFKGSGEFENGLTLAEVKELTSTLKYLHAGQYAEQNAIINQAGLENNIDMLKADQDAEKNYEKFKSAQLKAFEEAKKAESKTKEGADATKAESKPEEKKPKNIKEAFEIIDSYADAFKAYQAEQVKSDEYLLFLKEAKKIDTLFGKVKTLFDSRRAISKPLYGVLTALVVASAALVAPVAYTASIMAVALSALAYAAGKLLTIRDISARQKIKMTEVSSSAITVGSKWEIGTAIATTAAAALLGPLGLAARYSVYLGETVRAAVSLLVSTSVNLKELTVNMKTPLLMSDVQMQGSVSDKAAVDAFVNGQIPTSTYSDQLAEVVKTSKFPDLKDFKVNEKIESKEVKSALEKSVEFANRISELRKENELNMVDTKPLVADLTSFVKSATFKEASAHKDLNLQSKGHQLLRQMSVASANFVNTVKLVRGQDKANKFNKQTHEANLDFGLSALATPIAAV
ncbi:MAG: hypothetical protein VX737_05820 [Pseudomonadota bacterium]|nr:hypothetical protein [Pseudomonadota bacterium]